ncbi:MAG: histidine phosphatase family protein [Thermodesulfobacteriota bacterium]
MTRIYLVRHGTTEWNQEEIFRGRVDIELNDTGRREAQALAHYFQPISLQAIYSSPLSRAWETAQAVAQGHKLEIILEPAFIDIDFGEWHGLPLKEVQEKFPTLYRAWREKPHTVIFPKGESLEQVRHRAWAGLQAIIQKSEDQTILIVSHRVITKVLICAALGLDNSHFWQIKQDTTAVNCFEYHRGRLVVSLINDTCHLKSIHAGTTRKDF